MTDVLLPKYSLKLLGRFELSGAEGPVRAGQQKACGVAGILACSAPVRQSREKLATLLWGSHFETQAQQNLRQTLFRCAVHWATMPHERRRRCLARARCDRLRCARLEALSGEGSHASLAAAADLYQDPLLADVNITEEAWADWLAPERLRLEGWRSMRYQVRRAGAAVGRRGVARSKPAIGHLGECPARRCASLIVQALAATDARPRRSSTTKASLHCSSVS